MWLPADYDGMKSHDVTPSLEAGMPVRPLAEAVADALARERELGLDRERQGGPVARRGEGDPREAVAGVAGSRG